MKYYTLQAIINGKSEIFSRKFSTRQKAMDYMFDYLDHAYLFGKQVDEEYAVGNKHNIAYVCDNNTRFIIRRVVR